MTLIITFALLIYFNNVSDISNSLTYRCNSYPVVEVDKPSIRETFYYHMCMELWWHIDGYDGRYFVSTYGRVKSNTNRMLKQSLNANGYCVVYLSRFGYKSDARLVHRLVAGAFIPNTDRKSEINHKDCNKRNNHITNLEWATRMENMKHAVNNGRMVGRRCNNVCRIYGGLHMAAKPLSMLCRSTGMVLRTFGSATEAAAFIAGIPVEFNRRSMATHISNACRISGLTAYGYKWAYV